MLTIYHGAADEQRGIVIGNLYTDLIDLLPIGLPILITLDSSKPNCYFLAVTGTQVKISLKLDPASQDQAIIRLYSLAG